MENVFSPPEGDWIRVVIVLLGIISQWCVRNLFSTVSIISLEYSVALKKPQNFPVF